MFLGGCVLALFAPAFAQENSFRDFESRFRESEFRRDREEDERERRFEDFRFGEGLRFRDRLRFREFDPEDPPVHRDETQFRFRDSFGESDFRSGLSFGGESDELKKFLEEERKRELEDAMRRIENFDQTTYLKMVEQNSKLYEIGERFKRSITSRMRNRVEFVGVDIDNPSTLRRLDDYDRNEFNKFMVGRVARASEWYAANFLDPEADELRDLLPPELRDFKWIKFGSLRFGTRSGRPPGGVGNLLNGVPNNTGTTLDGTADSTITHPFIDAGTRFDPEQLGELRFNLRLRGTHAGAGLGWRPWPEDFPIQFRADFDHGFRSGRDALETSAMLDLYDLWTGNNNHKEHFYFYARWDFEEDKGWFGVMFSSNG